MFLLTKKNQDSLFKLLVKTNGLAAVIFIILIFIFLISESLPLIQSKGHSFFFDNSWYPSENQYNLTPMVIATLFTSLGAIILAIPLGLFAALCTTFYLNEKMSWIFRRVVELFSAIPSVIFGFWGLMELVPLINRIHPPGQSLLAGILILALMIFPILTLNLISSFELASKKLLNVSNSLGLKKSTYIWKILLPSSRGQFLSAIILSLGRAIGETMAVLMVCGNIVKVPTSFFQPVRTLTANMALEMSYAVANHRSALFLAGFILLMIVTLLVFLTDHLKGKGHG